MAVRGLILVCGVLAVVVMGGLGAGSADEQVRPGAVVVDEYFSTQGRGVSPVQGFSAYDGRWEPADSVLRAPAGSGPKLVYDDIAISDGRAGVDVFFEDDRLGNAGLIVKVTHAGVGADHFNGYEVSLYPDQQMLRLARHRQNFELIRDIDCEVPIGRWISLEVRMRRTGLEILVDGQSYIDYEDTEHPLVAGAIGLRQWQRPALYRNLWVKKDGHVQQIPFKGPETQQEQGLFAGWRSVRSDTARGRFSVEPDGPFGFGQSQRIEFADGRGRLGMAHAGSDRAGLTFVGSREYRGFVIADGDRQQDIYIGVENEEAQLLAQAKVSVSGGGWQRLGFSLAPKQSTATGRLVVTTDAPGVVKLGRVYIQAGDWAWPGSLAFDDLSPILFLRRRMLDRPAAVGTDIWQAQPQGPGCEIAIVDPSDPAKPLRTVFADPNGSIYDINLSFDAKTVYFSYMPEDSRYWNLWQIDVDGSNLRQITDGPYYDVGPAELPDGDIVFVSTRRGGYTVCQPGPASNLYRVSPDGGRPQCLSMNTLSDATPQVLPDGRVLFMRWEYVDRDLTYRQSLWTQNPDGTGYQLFFGNTLRDPGTIWQARPIPGQSSRVLATFAPHHNYPHGAIGWVDRRFGTEAPRGIGHDWITQEFPHIGDTEFVWSYRDPFPLDDDRFLCSYGGAGRRFGIYLHDQDDKRRLVYEDAQMHSFFPIALRPVPRPPILEARAPARDPNMPDLPEDYPFDQQPMGTVVLTDVYQGMGPAVERGQARAIRITEQVRKTVDIPVPGERAGIGPRAFDQSPLMSYGTYYAKRIWGEVPIESDGSAHFKVPALREIYFQVIDADGKELQRMTSAAQLMPGELLGCAGCHEPRNSAPAQVSMPSAARREPSEPVRADWLADDGMIDFVSVVQPVLDRNCASCHSGTDPAGGYDFSGDKTRFFNMAYDNLLGRSHSYRQHNMQSGEMLPEEAARGKPLVHFFWLLETPTGVNQPLWAGSHVSRLPEFLTAEHTGRPISREDQLRVFTWIDSNVPYYGTYATSRPRSGGKRDLASDPQTGRPARWLRQEFMPVYNSRCSSCHGDYPADGRGYTNWQGRAAWINFSRPDYSPALNAHLAKEAGGRGIDRTAEGTEIPMFEDISDPDYQTMLRVIRRGAEQALETPRADMQGFEFKHAEP